MAGSRDSPPMPAAARKRKRAHKISNAEAACIDMSLTHPAGRSWIITLSAGMTGWRE
jgi:hypothetical protein